MLLQDFIVHAWRDHEIDPESIACRFIEIFKQISHDNEIPPLVNLVVHVLGQHLNRWDETIELLNLLLFNSYTAKDGPGYQAIIRWKASIELVNGGLDFVQNTQFAILDKIYINTQALSIMISMPLENNSRIVRLFEENIKLASNYKNLISDERIVKLLAQVGNNLSCRFEEIKEPSKLELECMILAANTARQYWEIAGGYLEIQRAEYRLAKAFLKYGDMSKSLYHANLCLDICQKNTLPPIELFFAYEILSLTHKSNGDLESMENAQNNAKIFYRKLSAKERSWLNENVF